MKKIIITLAIAVSAVTISSCKHGCGCPGGAGYKQTKSQNNYTPKVSNLTLFRV